MNANMPHTSPLLQAGIANTRFDGDHLVIREIGNAAFVRVHAVADAEGVAAALATHGFPASVVPNTSAGSDRAALCLRPREWLLFSEGADPAQLLDEIRAAFDPASVAILPQSDGLACVRLSGAAAPWLLAKLSGVDYHAAEKKGQYCLRTRLAQVTVLVHRHPDPDPATGAADTPFVYDLVFDRSIAAYLWNILLRSASHAGELVRPGQ